MKKLLSIVVVLSTLFSMSTFAMEQPPICPSVDVMHKVQTITNFKSSQPYAYVALSAEGLPLTKDHQWEVVVFPVHIHHLKRNSGDIETDPAARGTMILTKIGSNEEKYAKTDPDDPNYWRCNYLIPKHADTVPFARTLKLQQ